MIWGVLLVCVKPLESQGTFWLFVFEGAIPLTPLVDGQRKGQWWEL